MIQAAIQGRKPGNPFYEAAEVSPIQGYLQNNKAALPRVTYDLHHGRKHTSFVSVRRTERLTAPANDGSVVATERYKKEEMKEDGAEDGVLLDRRAHWIEKS